MNSQLLEVLFFIVATIFVGYAYYEYGWKRDKLRKEKRENLKKQTKTDSED